MRNFHVLNVILVYKLCLHKVYQGRSLCSGVCAHRSLLIPSSTTVQWYILFSSLYHVLIFVICAISLFILVEKYEIMFPKKLI